jgi:hypothetical protein
MRRKAAAEVARQLVQPVQLDIDGVFRKAAHHVLPHQGNGGRGHGDDGEQDGNKQAESDRKAQNEVSR